MRDALQPYYWRFQLVGWALYCLLTQVWSYFLFDFQLSYIYYYVLELLVLWSTGVLASHLMFIWADHHGWLAMSTGKLWARVLGGCLLMGHVFIIPLTMFYTSPLVHMPEGLQEVLLLLGDPTAPLVYVAGGVTFAVKLVLWFLIVWVIYQQKQGAKLKGRQRMLELELQSAQMNQLRQQLNPHFLFNCMNSIRAMIHIDKAESSRMVDELTRILRYTLQKSDERVALSEELKVVDSYLSLEKARLGDRLEVERHIQPQALDFQLPPFLLQTLVENAIKHGISQRIAGGRVELAASVDGDGLKLVIRNDGELNNEAAGLGIGLTNSRERLRLLYGRDDLLSIEHDGHSVISRLQIPAKALIEAEHG